MTGAPGCFGSPTAYAPQLAVCQQCSAAKDCANKAAQTYQTIQNQLGRTLYRRAFGVEQDAPKRSSADLKMERRRVVETPGSLPDNKNAARLVASIRKSNLQVSEIRMGKNPFVGQKPAFMEYVVALLLEKQTFTKKDLARWLEEKTNLNSQSAASHASFALHALHFLEIVTVRNERYQRIMA